VGKSGGKDFHFDHFSFEFFNQFRLHLGPAYFFILWPGFLECVIGGVNGWWLMGDLGVCFYLSADQRERALTHVNGRLTRHLALMGLLARSALDCCCSPKKPKNRRSSSAAPYFPRINGGGKCSTGGFPHSLNEVLSERADCCHF